MSQPNIANRAVDFTSPWTTAAFETGDYPVQSDRLLDPSRRLAQGADVNAE